MTVSVPVSVAVPDANRCHVSLLQYSAIIDKAAIEIACASRKSLGEATVGASFRAREESIEVPVGGP